MKKDLIYRSAILSDCGKYRYVLSRWWDGASKKAQRVVFLMMNPSTADALTDDPTIRKCIGFAKRWGYGGINVINLFAYRSTDPQGLRGVFDLWGPDYFYYFEGVTAGAPSVVCAWGCEDVLKVPRLAHLRDEVLTKLRLSLTLTSVDNDVLCLGFTKGGTPRHPLMLAYDTPLIPMTGFLNPLRSETL